MLIIEVEIVLGLIAEEIGNTFCTAPKCNQNFDARFGATVVPKHALYGLNTAYNIFYNFFGDFLRYLGFTTSRADQYLWLKK